MRKKRSISRAEVKYKILDGINDLFDLKNDHLVSGQIISAAFYLSSVYSSYESARDNTIIYTIRLNRYNDNNVLVVENNDGARAIFHPDGHVDYCNPDKTSLSRDELHMSIGDPKISIIDCINHVVNYMYPS